MLLHWFLILEMKCRFVKRESNDFQEECHSPMLLEIMNISRLIVHDDQVEEVKDKRKSCDVKRARSINGGSSKSRIYIQEKRRLKKRFSNQVPTDFPKARDDSVSKPMSQMGKCSPIKKTSLRNCERNNMVIA